MSLVAVQLVAPGSCSFLVIVLHWLTESYLIHMQLNIQLKTQGHSTQIFEALSLHISNLQFSVLQFWQAQLSPTLISVSVQQDCWLVLGFPSLGWGLVSASRNKARFQRACLGCFLPFVDLSCYLVSSVWKQLFHTWAHISSCLLIAYGRTASLAPVAPSWFMHG